MDVSAMRCLATDVKSLSNSVSFRPSTAFSPFRPSFAYFRPSNTVQTFLGVRSVVYRTWNANWKAEISTYVICHSSSDDLKESSTHTPSPRPWGILKNLTWIAFAALTVFVLTTSQSGVAFRRTVMSSWIGQSGFVAALSLIFLSEIGDKTFFICAILAMRLGRWISFLGTLLALSAMTILSVGLGVAFNVIPEAMRTSIPIGKYLSVALLFFFGIRSIWIGMGRSKSTSEDERAEAEETIAHSETVKSDPTAPRLSLSTFKMQLRSIFVVSALIFVAEWGDRSMLTTIALGASRGPLGVALGGIVGHALAAMIAVVGGSFISSFISEKGVNLIAGILFIVFAIATTLNWT